MHGEPDRRLGGVGPLDAVAAVGRQVDVVAGPERPRPVLARDEEPCGASEHHDPLVQGLVVPEPRRARLPVATMRSIRTAGDRTSVSTSSAADFPESP